MRGDDCQDVFAKLSEYLDRELPSGACADLDRHIAGCEPCIRFIESLRKSVSLTRELGEVERPEPLSDEVRQKLREAFERMAESRRGQQ